MTEQSPADWNRDGTWIKVGLDTQIVAGGESAKEETAMFAAEIVRQSSSPCTLSPITCRCGGTHRPLTTPAGVTLEPGQTEAERRTRLLVGARSVGDANRAMTGKPPKCRCSKGARCLACIERDELTKAQA